MGLFNWLAGGGLQAADSLLGRFFTNKDLRETNIHDEQKAAYDQWASEYQFRGQRFWFDSFIDGINRMPRPLMAFTVIGILVYAPIDPINFSIIMQAYSLVPEWLALVFAQIILLFMGGRMLSSWGRMKGPSLDQVRQFMVGMEELKKMRALRDDDAKRQEYAERMAENLKKVKERAEEIDPNDVEEADLKLETIEPMDPYQYEREMANEDRPLSNDAIMEWNRRRQEERS